MPPVDRSALPWEERERLGFLPALLETVKLLVTDPQEAFSRLKPDGDYLGPFLFGLVVAWVMTVISQMWSVTMSSVFTLGDASSFGVATGFGFLQMIFFLVLYPVLHLIIIFLWSGLHHLGLMIFSGLDRSSQGFEGTFKVVSYAMVAQLANIVPVIGPLLSLVGLIVLVVIGFQKVHGSSQIAAVGGALMPTVLCCLCMIVLMVVFGGAIAAALAGAGGAAAFQ
ncbi:MAG: YIP1 family protein [Acidobacteriota bacterium]